MFSNGSNLFAKLAIGSAVCILFAMSASTVSAQAGRRLPRSPSVTVPTPEPTPQPQPATSSNTEPRLYLIVGEDRGDLFSGIPLYYNDSVLQSCAQRLDDAHGVKVEMASKEMTRSDAVKRAKAESQAFVVWLRLRADNLSSSSSTNPDAIYLEYTVFEPVTAKTVTQGSAYQSRYAKGGVVIGPGTGTSNVGIIEARLKYAAEEAAERILKALHILLPSEIPPH
jgi:hypothetical protein